MNSVVDSFLFCKSEKQRCPFLSLQSFYHVGAYNTTHRSKERRLSDIREKLRPMAATSVSSDVPCTQRHPLSRTFPCGPALFDQPSNSVLLCAAMPSSVLPISALPDPWVGSWKSKSKTATRSICAASRESDFVTRIAKKLTCTPRTATEGGGHKGEEEG